MANLKYLHVIMNLPRDFQIPVVNFTAASLQNQQIRFLKAQIFTGKNNLIEIFYLSACTSLIKLLKACKSSLDNIWP